MTPGQEGLVSIRAYLRVSTTKQAEAGGVESQRAAIERWADGREVVWYEDNGCSGATMDREAWQRMLAEVEKGDTIAVYDLSRAGRDSLAIMTWARDMLSRGISVAFVGQGFNLEAGPVGALILTVWAAVVQFERDMIAVKTRAGMAATKRKVGLAALRIGPDGNVYNVNTGEPAEISEGARGRLPKTTAATVAEARRLKRETGQTWEQVAAVMGWAPRTLYKALRRWPEWQPLPPVPIKESAPGGGFFSPHPLPDGR
jgi:DNA invertase Pin-like site-specific DNA recombinase